MPGSFADLHIHSTASDGLLTPSEVVGLALAQGLSAIALTDHDTLAGVVEAQAAARGTQLDVIAGVEISSEGSWGDLHFLGFYVDADNAFLAERLRAMQEGRLSRARQMVQRLSRLGMPLQWEEVETLAAGQSVGRPHIARALRNRGYVSSVQEAFDRYIDHGGPAYVPRPRLTPDEVIAAIHRAGGVAVLAHPAHSNAIRYVPDFASCGLQGLEVYYPTHSPEDQHSLLDLCQRYNLLVTGGSDFHGPGHAEGAELGAVCVPPDCVLRLKQIANQSTGRDTRRTPEGS